MYTFWLKMHKSREVNTASSFYFLLLPFWRNNSAFVVKHPGIWAEKWEQVYPNWDRKGWLLPGDDKWALITISKDIWKPSKKIQEDCRIWDHTCVVFSMFSTKDMYYCQNQKGKKWMTHLKRPKRSDLSIWVWVGNRGYNAEPFRR